MGAAVGKSQPPKARRTSRSSAPAKRNSTSPSASPTAAHAKAASPRSRGRKAPKQLSSDLGIVASRDDIQQQEIKPQENTPPTPKSSSSPSGEHESTETPSDDALAFPASTVGGSHTGDYSQFQFNNMTDNEQDREDGEAAAQTELEGRHEAIDANLLSPVSPPATVDGVVGAAATAPDPHANSYSLWTPTEDGGRKEGTSNANAGAYPISMQHQYGEEVPTVEATTPLRYVLNLTSPMAGKKAEESPTRYQITQQQQEHASAGSPTARPPSAVAWRAPPAPPAPSPYVSRQRPPPPPPQPQPPQQLLSTVYVPPSHTTPAADARSIEVVPTSPPLHSGGSTKSKAKKTNNPGSISSVNSGRSTDAKRKGRKGAQTRPHATAEQQLPNLRSVLGASPGLAERSSPDFLNSSAYRPVSRVEDRASVTPCLSARASVTPSLRATANISALGTTAPAHEKEQKAAAATSAERTPLGNTADKDMTRPSSAASALNFDLGPTQNSSSSRQGQMQRYGSFMSDYVASMSTSARAPSPVITAVEVRPARPAMKSKTTPRSTPAQEDEGDINYYSMIGNRRDSKSKKAAPISPAPPESKQQQRHLQQRKKSTEDAMGTSLINLSPPESKLNASQLQSPMNSPTELFLPYARNLRPRQWQYASILHKKIEEKTQGRRAKTKEPHGARHTTTTTAPGQRLLSATAGGRPGARAVSRPASPSLMKQHLLPQFDTKVVGPEKAVESTTPRLAVSAGQEENDSKKKRVHGEEEEEDLFANSYFFNNSSIVIPATSENGSPAATSKPAAPAVEKVAPVIHGAVPAATAVARAQAAGEEQLSGGKRRKTKGETRMTALSKGASKPTALTQELVESSSDDGYQDGDCMVSRRSSLLSVNVSVFTDNGYPLLDPHLSDLYKESDSSSFGMTSITSISATMDASRERLEPPTVTMVDGRRVLQGVGYANRPAANSSCLLDGLTTPTKQVQLPPVPNPSDESGMASMKAVAGRPPIPPRRWSAAGGGAAAGAAAVVPNSPAMRHQALHDQQRRLLREQQMRVRQLRQNEPSSPASPQSQQQRAPQPLSPQLLNPYSTNSPLHGSPRAQTAAATVTVARSAASSPNAPQRQQQQPQFPPPLPMPQSRSQLASAFFTGENPQLKVDHRGMTCLARPQPDIKYGPFVATDRSRNIDFKKTLGFGLEDVPMTRSPNWDALPRPELNEDTEEL